jgi:hypothetical protein
METTKKYLSILNEIKKESKLLSDKLKKHNVSFKGHQSDWGYVGDLNNVLEKLKELNLFLNV